MFYKCVMQHDTNDCAWACLASISWYYGKKISIGELEKGNKINEEGVNLLEVKQAAEMQGLKCTPVKCDEKFNIKEIPLPCVAYVFVENGRGHYIVIYKVSKDKIIIADPAVGIMKIDRKDFLNPTEGKEPSYLWSRILLFLQPDINFKKGRGIPKKFIHNRFYKLILEEREKIVLVTIFSFISMGITILSSFYMKILIDTIIPNSWLYTLTFITVSFIILTLGKAILDKERVRHSLLISKRINTKLSMEYYKHILNLPMKFFDVKKKGEIISRFQDTSKIQEVLIINALILPVDITYVVIVSILLITKSVGMFVLVTLICLSYCLVMLSFGKQYNERNSKQMAEDARMVTNLVETLEGIETIKVYSQEEQRLDKGGKVFGKWQSAILALGNMENSQMALKTIINSVGEIVILGVGAAEVINSNITIGELMALNMLVGFLITPLRNIIDLQPQFHAAKIAMERLESIFEIQIEDKEGSEIEKIQKIGLQEVSFSYTGKENILKGVNMEIKEGESIAIIGSSGSGKTTIAKLLIKLYTPDSGHITLNGIDSRKLSVRELRQKIVYVSQEDFMFNGSIKENLTLNKEIVFDEILEISKLVGIHEFVSHYPQQYDTYIEERGNNLSKGQKQKIAIGRALLMKPEVLILDEATSNMDSESEDTILTALETLETLILIVITHRVTVAKRLKKVYSLKNGNIIHHNKDIIS